MKKVLFFLFLSVFGLSLDAQVYLDPQASVEERVEDLLSGMDLLDKIGQMTQANWGVLQPGDVSKFRLGSLLAGGNSMVGPALGGNGAESWANLYDSKQTEALSGDLKIPLLWGVDAIHGHGIVDGATVFPHNVGLGAAKDPVLMEQIGRITAKEVRATGLNWNFGPCIAVARDIRWGRTYESFGEDPGLHDVLVTPYIKGFQGESFPGENSIMATAKHWLGDGGTYGGIDQGDAQDDEQTFRDIHMRPYIKAVEAGVKSVMVTYSSWQGEKLHGSKYWITDVLKGELGFDGIVVSDWAGMYQVHEDYKTAVKMCINAGIDVAMAAHDWHYFIPALEELVLAGEVSMERIDDAVRRILKVKFEMGLFENPYADRSLLDSFGSAEHTAVAREAVRKSLVLLQNKNNILPLSKSPGSILVAGRNGDDIGYQCGGWTLGWQGDSDYMNKMTGTSIYEGIKAAVTEDTVVDYDLSGYGAEAYDLAILVLGEQPYAEDPGYDADLAFNLADRQLLDRVYKTGTPVIVVLVSGRPMILTEDLPNFDALVAAWLPGKEGAGIADLLFGDYDFTGTLAFSWPKDASQLPLNVDSPGYDPLFPYGFGLNWSGVIPLPEPTPTPTSIPIPTPSPTPTPNNNVVQPLYKCTDSAQTANQNVINLKVINNTDQAIALEDVAVRYFYTKEGDADEEFNVDFAVLGSTNIILTPGNGYLEISFTPGAGSLEPGSDSGEIIIRINKTDWSLYDRWNDYSFVPEMTEYAVSDKMLVLQKGQIVWGNDPLATPEPTPEATPTPLPPCMSVAFIHLTGYIRDSETGEEINNAMVSLDIPAHYYRPGKSVISYSGTGGFYTISSDICIEPLDYTFKVSAPGYHELVEVKNSSDTVTYHINLVPDTLPLYKTGDADGDGEVSILDALMIARFSVGLPVEGFIEPAGDVDGDGQVTILDALKVARVSVGLETL